MIRVIVDSQSNRLFRGVPQEQAYDQRGGLCEVGEGDVVVTTNPFDPDYLQYWKETLGFDLPHLMVAGPFDPHCTLSELILLKHGLQNELRRMLGGEVARLEFFCIEESERKLATTLDIRPYCNFEIAIKLSRKPAFKRLFNEVGIPTPRWVSCAGQEGLLTKGKAFSEAQGVCLLKTEDGTGGFTCGGMFLIKSPSELYELARRNGDLGREVIVEELVTGVQTVSAHWEISDDKTLKPIGVFDQQGEYAYSGVSWPSSAPAPVVERILADITHKLGPWLIKKGAVGFFCADIVIDKEGRHWWVDFNPRKGAILYVYNMIRRLSTRHFGGTTCRFFHEHFRLPEGGDQSFAAIRDRLSNLLLPDERFVVITNPGLIAFGYADVTGVSLHSLKEAKLAFDCAKKNLLH